VAYDAVIVHYRDPDAVRALVSRLQRQSVPPQQILIADNSASEHPFGLSSGSDPRVSVLPIPGNPGYGAAVNRGVEQLEVSGGGAKYVLILTQDVDLSANCVEELLLAVEFENAVCAAPLLFYASDRSRLYSSGGRISKTGFPAHRRSVPSNSAPEDIFWADGAVLLVDKLAVRRAGGFWEGYFLYYEEVELCARLLDEGGRVISVPSATAWQEPGNFTRYLQVRNLIHLRERMGIGTPAARFLWSFTSASRAVVGSLARGQFRDVLAAVRGLADGLRGVSGPPRRSKSAR